VTAPFPTEDPARIALVNTWHDDNRGDAAIAQTTLRLLSNRWPDAEVTVVSLLDDRHEEFDRAHRHLTARNPRVGILGNALPHLDRHGGRRRVVTKCARFTMAVPGALLGALSPGRSRRAALMAVRDADLVVVSGGHSTYSQGGLLAWVNLLRVLLPVHVAHRAGVPTVFLGHTLGPFPDRISRRIAGHVLSRAGRVVARESASAAVATSLGVAPSRVEVAPDVAFALTPSDTDRVDALCAAHRLERGDFWVVTVRQAYEAADRDARTDRFLTAMAGFVRTVLDEGRTARVVLCAHTIGPVANEDDRRVTRRLAEQLPDPRVSVVDDDLDPEELAAFYGRAGLLVGTRLHSVILSLAAGTPAVALAYFGTKAQGTMALVGAPELCLAYDEATAPVLVERLDTHRPVERRDELAERARALGREVAGLLERT
jgi:colanic acid/amylovoran biosynthesis protein